MAPPDAREVPEREEDPRAIKDAKSTAHHRGMARLHASLIALLLGGVVAACGGSGDGGTQSPSPTPPAPANQNPCISAAVGPEAEALTGAQPAPATASTKTDILDGTSRYRVLDALWIHQQQAARAAARPAARSVSDADVGDIAVIQDQGDIILPPNTSTSPAPDCDSRATAVADTMHNGSTARFARRLAAGSRSETTTASR